MKKKKQPQSSRRMVKQLAKVLFRRVGNRPSRPYRLGFQTMLLRRIVGFITANPYRTGSADYDDFRSGQRRALLVDWETIVSQAMPLPALGAESGARNDS